MNRRTVFILIIVGIIILTASIMLSYGNTTFKTDSDLDERLQAEVGQTVTYSGFARDAKAGAVVSIEGVVGVDIYIDKLAAWPAEYLDKKITVTGTLVYKQYIPRATVIDGAHSQGADGMQYVLENPLWKQ